MSDFTKKPLYKLIDKPIIEYVIDELRRSIVDEICIVKSPDIKMDYENITYYTQPHSLGSADALRYVPIKNDIALVLPSDIPLLNHRIINEGLKHHLKKKNDITVLTARLINPQGYGRIKYHPLRIVEQLDLKKRDKKNNEINTGIYIMNDRIFSYLDKIKLNKRKNEYYLTDILKVLPKKYKRGIFEVKDGDLIKGVNTLKELNEAYTILVNKINSFHLDNKIYLENPIIGIDVKIKEGTKLYGHCRIIGKTTIGKNVTIIDSTIEDSIIGDNTIIGPYAHIKNNSIIKENTIIGNFVEIKDSQIEKDCKIKHLSYVGNTQIASNVNIGAGVVICNYDGIKKSQSYIDSYSFIGSNSTIISPVNIGFNSYIGAGSVVNKDVSNNMFYLRRAEEITKINNHKVEKKSNT